MLPRHMAAGIRIVQKGHAVAQNLLDICNMVPPEYGDGTSMSARARKVEPVGGEPEVPDRCSEYLDRDPAAAEGCARTALGMGEDIEGRAGACRALNV